MTVVGYSLLELWERIEEDAVDMGLPFDAHVKTWCWKLIRKMPDVECYTSANNAKIKFVKGNLCVIVLILL